MHKSYQIERFAPNHCVVWLLHHGKNSFKEIVFKRQTDECLEQCWNYKKWAENKEKRSVFQ